ncbi:ABC transporter ATP-binding protein [Streptomyces olivoreticuli]|uniref:ATP-binding cassette domain-containing protein n=1 Tax=Streptomyces olivoreticuli TaxID=68246 RepID=UPI002658E7F5|nr:ABC transporter ATP-binding protein [Streptomyces olivoreticuli]WKK26619.1 ABC transporter ATP-binding protein [Streptomyces olivoreticuli]
MAFRVLAWTAVESLPALLAGRLVAAAVDSGFLNDAPLVGMMWLGALAAASAIGAYGAKSALSQSAALVEPLRDALVSHTVELSLRQATTGGRWRQDLSGVARLTRQVEVVREAAGSLLLVVCRFSFAFIGVCIGTLTLDPVAAVLIFSPVILTIGCYALSLRTVARTQLRSIVATETLAQEAWELSAGLRDIAACGAEDLAFRQLETAALENARAEELLARLNALRTIALGLGGWLPLVLILLWARWGTVGTSAGTVLGVLTYVVQNLRPAVQALVQALGTTGIRLFVTLGRLLEEPGSDDRVIPPPSPTRRRTEAGEPPAHELDISLRKVSFSYSVGGNNVLEDVDIHVSAGEHLTVVGPSGIGKSTLASLIAGTLGPTRGSVVLDGTDLRDIPPERQAVLRTYLPQEAYVFTGTLRENLIYLCDGEVSDDQLDRAVRDIGLDNLLDRAGGYKGLLRPEDLSAGERQLIALARAHLSPARLIILDEATCHLDPAAEARAERALQQRPGTLVVVAHRISSALTADRVIVMDGTCVRLGSHEEMLSESMLYRDLVGLWGPTAGPA